MKSSFLLISNLCLASVIITATSCGNASIDENINSDLDSTSAEAQISETTQDFFYSLPSPLLMAKIFKRTGLKYIEGIANPPENVSKYTSVHSKTLNLGIYSADLAYTVLNKQSHEASRYMEAVKRLSDELGMSSLFDADDYLKRFKNNLSNEDSLINVVCELKSEMDIFMKDNNKEKQTLLIFIGAWVENMYIATQLTKESNKEKVAARVAEQKYVLNSLMNVTSQFQGDEEFKELFSKISELKSYFDSVAVQDESGITTVDQNQLKTITEKTRDLRKSIVG